MKAVKYTACVLFVAVGVQFVPSLMRSNLTVHVGGSVHDARFDRVLTAFRLDRMHTRVYTCRTADRTLSTAGNTRAPRLPSTIAAD